MKAWWKIGNLRSSSFKCWYLEEYVVNLREIYIFCTLKTWIGPFGLHPGKKTLDLPWKFLMLAQRNWEMQAMTALHLIITITEITLTIGNSCIKPSQTIRNLGAYFDSIMTMASHITNVSRTITFHLRNISRIRKYIDKDTCHYAVRSLILSHIDYCNGLLSSLPKSYTLRLQRLQNWAARLVFTVHRQQDPKPLLKSLHWLPVKQRISFKLLLYVFKSP